MPAGRPSDYKPEYAEQAEKLCKLGATDVELADFFNVSERTIYRWQTQFPEFCQALKAGKDAADERVERSLYHRAVGYSHPDVHVSNYRGVVTLTDLVKHYPPDTVAAIFWLKNRRSEAWRDKTVKEIDASESFVRLLEQISAGRTTALDAGVGEQPGQPEALRH